MDKVEKLKLRIRNFTPEKRHKFLHDIINFTESEDDMFQFCEKHKRAWTNKEMPTGEIIVSCVECEHEQEMKTLQDKLDLSIEHLDAREADIQEQQAKIEALTKENQELKKEIEKWQEEARYHSGTSSQHKGAVKILEDKLRKAEEALNYYFSVRSEKLDCYSPQCKQGGIDSSCVYHRLKRMYDALQHGDSKT